MAQGGATNPADSDQFIENIVKYIREKPDLVSKLEDLLKLNLHRLKINNSFSLIIRVTAKVVK